MTTVSVCSECHIAFYLPNLGGGGAERAIVQLSNSIADRGCLVEIVLCQATGPYLTEVKDNVRIVNLFSKGKLESIVSLMHYLRSRAPLVVMSVMDLPNIQLILAARLTRFMGKIIISQRATIAPVYAQVSLVHRLMYRSALNVTYPFSDAVICNSFTAAMEVKNIPGMCGEKVVTIHNSVDDKLINRLASEPLRDDFFCESNTPLILSVGSLTKLKDRLTLVRAFSILKAKRPVRLVILGEGDEREKIETIIAELHLSRHCYLPGFDSNPYRWMRRAAVLVSSSITEGCPNNLLEGLALGVPIVATNCPGDTAELLDHGNWGRLVPVGDPESMAEAILSVLDNPNPPDGRSRAADFSPSKITSAYLNVLLPKLDHATCTSGQSE